MRDRATRGWLKAADPAGEAEIAEIYRKATQWGVGTAQQEVNVFFQGTSGATVLYDDTDADGDSLSISAVTQGGSGSVAISGPNLAVDFASGLDRFLKEGGR